ncbi:hypothetical protein HZS_2369 [Henneguya salminicola]|nr:hypothetical protein HZS_2369 [Henneguya salminicola]
MSNNFNKYVGTDNFVHRVYCHRDGKISPCTAFRALRTYCFDRIFLDAKYNHLGCYFYLKQAFGRKLLKLKLSNEDISIFYQISKS